jgi:hypothetical protein
VSSVPPIAGVQQAPPAVDSLHRSRPAPGTCYANRCDYLDPLLAWTGVKETGRGVSLSHLGFGPFVRPMSLRLQEPGWGAKLG